MAAGNAVRPYDTCPADYARVLDPTLAGAAERLVELAGARPGMRLLDLATGTGAVARIAADKGASVVGVDASRGMLSVARRLSPDLDLRLADARELPFKEGEFEAVTCGLSVTHFGDCDQALREALRVLREGGRFVASAWGQGVGTPSSAAAMEVVKRYGATESDSGLDEETWFEVEKGSEMLRRAAFADVSARTERFSGSFADVDEALKWAFAWPVRAAGLARIDPSDRDGAMAEARQSVAAADLTWRFVFNFYLGHRPAPAASSP
jgi:ubiquinone/menaquinone biosynthesis C-methylase UbiE